MLPMHEDLDILHDRWSIYATLLDEVDFRIWLVTLSGLRPEQPATMAVLQKMTGHQAVCRTDIEQGYQSRRVPRASREARGGLKIICFSAVR